MKKLRWLIYLIGILTGSLIPASCISDEFTTSSTDILTFSRDTVSFDTVFTGQGTPTARLIVRNPAKKSVSIASIGLADPESPFRINVDGMSGKYFRDVEIRDRDSIYVFIECTLPESAGSAPALVSDELEFVTNGVRQSVLLEAWGQNVLRLKGRRVTGTETLTAELPVVVYDSLVVEPGAVLRLEPGLNLLFHADARLVVHGTLEARGERGREINMRGDRLDNVLPDVPYDLLAGQWGGVRFSGSSYGNVMDFVDMRSTVDGLVVDSCADLSQRKLLLRNSWIHNSQACALRSSHAWVDAYSCVFSEAADNVVDLTGGRHRFVQCTVSNYYLFSGLFGNLINLSHCLPQEGDADASPLMEAEFCNMIVYGLGSPINEGDLAGSQVYFRNVLFGVGGDDDANYISCLWDSDPLFYTVRDDYLFDYHVQADSPAIGAGNPEFVTSECNPDPDGVDRLGAGNPTLGAFQYVARPEEEEQTTN